MEKGTDWGFETKGCHSECHTAPGEEVHLPVKAAWEESGEGGGDLLKGTDPSV